MGKERVFIVLPKISAYNLNSYNHKDLDALDILKEKLNSWLDLFAKYTSVEICCFAEDKLAVELLSEDNRISWISVLANSDSNYYKICGYATDKYMKLEKIKADTTIVNTAVKRFKVKKQTEFVDDTAFKGHREQVMNNRIRYAIDEMLNKEKYIVYFNQMHNFCKEPEAKLGDGKLLIIHNLVRMFEFFYYGGVPISRDNLEMIIGGLFNG